MSNSNPSKCCDRCRRVDRCSEVINRCIRDSPDCDHCRECQTFDRAINLEFVRASSLLKARG